MIAPTISGDAAVNGNEILFLTVKFVPIFYVNFFCCYFALIYARSLLISIFPHLCIAKSRNTLTVVVVFSRYYSLNIIKLRAAAVLSRCRVELSKRHNKNKNPTFH